MVSETASSRSPRGFSSVMYRVPGAGDLSLSLERGQYYSKIITSPIPTVVLNIVSPARKREILRTDVTDDA